MGVPTQDVEPALDQFLGHAAYWRGDRGGVTREPSGAIGVVAASHAPHPPSDLAALAGAWAERIDRR